MVLKIAIRITFLFMDDFGDELTIALDNAILGVDAREFESKNKFVKTILGQKNEIARLVRELELQQEEHARNISRIQEAYKQQIQILEKRLKNEAIGNDEILKRENGQLRNDIADLQDRLDFVMDEKQNVFENTNDAENLSFEDIKNYSEQENFVEADSVGVLFDDSLSLNLEKTTSAARIPLTVSRTGYKRELLTVENLNSSCNGSSITSKGNLYIKSKTSSFQQIKLARETIPKKTASWKDETLAEARFNGQMLIRKLVAHDETLFESWNVLQMAYLERERVLKQLDELVGVEREGFILEQIRRLKDKRKLWTDSPLGQVSKLEHLFQRETQFRKVHDSKNLYTAISERRRVERLVRQSVNNWQFKNAATFFLEGFHISNFFTNATKILTKGKLIQSFNNEFQKCFEVFVHLLKGTRAVKFNILQNGLCRCPLVVHSITDSWAENQLFYI